MNGKIPNLTPHFSHRHIYTHRSLRRIHALLACIFTLLTINADTSSSLVGAWEFLDAAHPWRATVGTDLEVAGTAPHHAQEKADGKPYPLVIPGVITTRLGSPNHLLARHGIGPNGGGDRVNAYTMLFDMLVPDSGAWRGFYQTDINNSNDGEFFVRNRDNAIGRHSITYGPPVPTQRWLRLVVSTELGETGHLNTYIDGVLHHRHTTPPRDSEFSLDPQSVLLFADNDNENHPLEIGTVAIFNRALNAQEIAVLGGPGVNVMNAAKHFPIASEAPWAFLTPPYLQNMSTTGMVVMAEVSANIPLLLAYGTTANLGQSVAMESVASGGHTYFTRGIISGLEPGTTYHYQITSARGTALTPTSTFRTAPKQWEDFTFMAIGDVQTDNRIRKTNQWAWQADPWEPAKTMLTHMTTRSPRFLLGLGDHADDGNSYTRTKLSHLNRIASIFGPHAPFFIGWGNHDGNSPNHPLRLSADMPSRWQVESSPSTRTPGYGNFTFSYSGVFFVCFDYFEVNNKAENDPKNDLTNGWLDAQLSSHEAREARFRIVVIHVPPFCERWIDGNAKLREQLVPRMERHRVNLCLSGHMHGYQRGFSNGVHYVISGCGSYLDIGEPLVTDWPHITVGGHNNVLGTYAMQREPGVLGNPQPIQGGLFHGYAEITVRDRTLRLDQHGFNADGSYIGLMDSLEINNPSLQP